MNLTRRLDIEKNSEGPLERHFLDSQVGAAEPVPDAGRREAEEVRTRDSGAADGLLLRPSATMAGLALEGERKDRPGDQG